MHSFFQISLLVMAGIAHARVGRLPARADQETCCPCPSSGAPTGGTVTVTITQPAAAVDPTTVYIGSGVSVQPTVTVTVTESPAGGQPTVTVTEAGPTIYLTNPAVPAAAGNDAVQTVTVSLDPGSNRMLPPSEESSASPADVAPENDGAENAGSEPQTVTVISQPGASNVGDTAEQSGPVTVTVTPSAQLSGATALAPENPSPGTVTVTIAGPSVATGTANAADTLNEAGLANEANVDNLPIVEDTVASANAAGATVTVTLSSPAEATGASDAAGLADSANAGDIVDPANASGASATASDASLAPPFITVTAAPEQPSSPVVQTVDQFQTITQSVTNNFGDIDIVFNIINIYTGETICIKENREPCDASFRPLRVPGGFNSTTASNSTSTSCSTSTSIATAYNTVLVSGNQTLGYNATAVSGVAAPTGSIGLAGRIPRGPTYTRW